MDKKIGCLTKLKTLYPKMTVSEKEIADYILRNPEEIYSITINNIAKKINVSLPTVFRFTNKLGYKGFKDFKIDLIKDMAVGLNIGIEDIIEDSIEGVTINIFNKISNNLNETLSIIDYNELEKAINSIINAKRLLFFAVSTSISVAFDACSKFERAGFCCIFNTDSYSQRVISTQAKKGDTAIGISFSGESPDVIECLKNSRENGAETICVTTFMESSITKYSDIKLFTAPVQYYYQKIDIPSKMSQTVLLDCLYLNIILKNYNKAFRYLSKSEKELESFRKKFKID